MLRLIQKINILLLIAGIAACSSFDKPWETLEERVAVRAAERWKALIESRLETAYNYELPEYRKLYNFEQYRHGVHNSFWKKAEVRSVACEEICVVKVQIYATIQLARLDDPVSTDSILEEKWMQDPESGEWFHLSSK